MENEKVFRRRLAAAENMAVRQRNYRRARDRALARLAQNHKGEYLELLEQEKEADLKEGKRWHNLAGANASGWLDDTDKLTGKDRGDTAGDIEEEGNHL